MKWIVFEGPDCVGKSVIIREISKMLESNGFRTFTTAEPSKSPIGRLIREWLLREHVKPDHVYALLFTADRYYHYYNIVREMLKKGFIVLQERYKLSTLIYQSEMGLNENWLNELNKYLPDPDLMIILDADIDVLIQRLSTRSSREVFEEDLTMLLRVRKRYLEYASRLGIPVVRTDRALSDVVREVYDIIRRVL